MNKKNYLYAAMALPLFMAACSSEDVLTEVQDNGQYPGVEKVDAQFTLANDAESRLATKWGLEDGDVVGLAWLGDEDNIKIDGKAWQNHPLYAEGGMLKPKTSIYVGKYFSYAPYDYATKSVGQINFSIENQTLTERGEIVGNDDPAGIKATAAKSIWISPRWTEVTVGGEYDYTDRKNYNEAGVEKTFKMYPKKFSNMVQLELSYKNNEFSDAATPDIKGIEVSYGDNKSVVAFTYAPTEQLTQTGNISEEFWADYTLNQGSTTATTSRATKTSLYPAVNPTLGTIKLEGKFLADGKGNTFVYNSLPVNCDVTAETPVKLVITSTYGIITIDKKLSEIAKTYIKEKKGYSNLFDGETDIYGNKGVEVVESFISELNTNGKLITEVDFLTAVMDGMHVEDDVELQKMLNYYKNHKKGSANYSEAKNGTDIKLYLDGKNGTFNLSKTSIALIKQINGTTGDLLVSIQPCTTTGEACTKLVVTEGGEIPAMDRCFETEVDVYLAAGEAWEWTETYTHNNQVNSVNTGKNFGKVKNITNEGTLKLAHANIKAQGTTFETLINEGTINVTAAANVKFDIENNNTINVAKNAELAAYGSTINNNSWGTYSYSVLTGYEEAEINNEGTIGVVMGTQGEINNYGSILNKAGAKTYITTNQTADAKFAGAWSKENKLGTIHLTTKFDNVSVSNGTTQGFIKYTWDGEETYATPEPAVDVMYNYLIVTNNIKFTEFESEIKYLEVAAGADITITAQNVFGNNKRVSGFILGDGAKVNIRKGNEVYADAAYIHEGKMTVGGNFYYRSDLTTYFGGQDTDKDNIIVY